MTHPIPPSAVEAALKAWFEDPTESDFGNPVRCEGFHRRMTDAITAALPHLTGDEPEAPADPITPPPVLRIPSQVGSRLYLYPRGHDIDPEAHGMRAVAPAVYGAAVLILTAPDPRTGHPTTVARYLHAYQARQLGRALIAAADYAEETDHEEMHP